MGKEVLPKPTLRDRAGHIIHRAPPDSTRSFRHRTKPQAPPGRNGRCNRRGLENTPSGSSGCAPRRVLRETTSSQPKRKNASRGIFSFPAPSLSLKNPKAGPSFLEGPAGEPRQRGPPGSQTAGCKETHAPESDGSLRLKKAYSENGLHPPPENRPSHPS